MKLFFTRNEYLIALGEEREFPKELEALINWDKKQIEDEINSNNKDDYLINYLEAENKDYQLVLNRINKEIDEIESGLIFANINPCAYKGELSKNIFVEQANIDANLREQISSLHDQNINLFSGDNAKMVDTIFPCTPDVVLGYSYCV